LVQRTLYQLILAHFNRAANGHHCKFIWELNFFWEDEVVWSNFLETTAHRFKTWRQHRRSFQIWIVWTSFSIFLLWWADCIDQTCLRSKICKARWRNWGSIRWRSFEIRRHRFWLFHVHQYFLVVQESGESLTILRFSYLFMNKMRKIWIRILVRENFFWDLRWFVNYKTRTKRHPHIWCHFLKSRTLVHKDDDILVGVYM